MAKHDGVGRGRRDFVRIAGGSVVAVAAASLPGLGARPASAAPLKIGAVGAGHIGSTLGSMWVRVGHPVMLSSRHPEALKDLVESLGPLAHAGTVEEAIAFADVVLLAVPYRAMPEIGRNFAGELAGKVLVLDATNPIPARDGDIADWARKRGAGLASAELLPGVRLVRAFNAINYAKLPDAAHRQGQRTGIPIAGDDANAIAVASSLIREIGFEPVVIGSLAKGRYLIPGTPLAGEHTAEQIRQIAATLD